LQHPPDDELAPVGTDVVEVLQTQVSMRRSTVRASGSNPSKAACEVQRSGLVVAGTGVTNNQGVWRMSYSQTLLCGLGGGPDFVTMALRPIVVATARGTTPAVVTVGVTSNAQGDYRITVHSFNMQGAAAAQTPFAWQAVSLTHLVPDSE
jgi:hypothetical protein